MKKRILSILLVLLMVVSLVPISASASTNGHTAQEALTWVRSQLGKSLDYDGFPSYQPYQCVDLIKYYYEYLGCASYASGNGADYASNALPSGWARYKGAQPQPGDILVYSGTSDNPNGHVAIYEADNITYHQNFNGCAYVVRFNYHYKNDVYSPYWGVIRPDFGTGAIAGSWEGPTISEITETNARLYGKLVYNGKPHTTQMGVHIYDSSNKLVASKDESTNYVEPYVWIYYDNLASELGLTLVSGKTYKVVFYAIANGKEYWSPTVSFTTLHTHSYKNTVTAPTCTAKGYTTHTCSCGNSYKDTYVDALGHNYVSGVCTRCNAKDPNYQAPHTHSYTAAVTAPTCTAAGYTTHICSCGDSYKDNYVDALGHNYVSGVCTRCNAKDPNYQAPHAHSYTAAVTAPTCTAAGYTTHTCSCGDSYKDNYVNALGHNYVNGACTRCGAKDPNYKPAVSFIDVPSDAFYANSVKWAVENEITTGVGNNRFDPNGQCTRGQVVTFLWRAAGKPTVSANVSFSDVQPGAFYYEAVKWAVANGITQGVGGNRFAPNDTCTRGQVVTFLHRAANSPAASTASSFTDVPTTAFYYNAVNWAVANGITNGTGNGRFSPNDTCTRAQVVTFLYRAQ